eukprot:TRINITY_DN1484_c0_g1_i5.p1 TRINITY_DN1484_c0_g1~~TRINITY_DN1484_c0_g1_i5.p1  ORF type:complete len:186 (+),score=66.84 TRINITY_DN1484_c0_g1_i5:122-679(+)
MIAVVWMEIVLEQQQQQDDNNKPATRKRKRDEVEYEPSSDEEYEFNKNDFPRAPKKQPKIVKEVEEEKSADAKFKELNQRYHGLVEDDITKLARVIKIDEIVEKHFEKKFDEMKVYFLKEMKSKIESLKFELQNAHILHNKPHVNAVPVAHRVEKPLPNVVRMVSQVDNTDSKETDIFDAIENMI